MHGYLLEANTFPPSDLKGNAAENRSHQTSLRAEPGFIIALFPVFYAECDNCEDFNYSLKSSLRFATHLFSGTVCILFKSLLISSSKFYPPSVIFE